MYLRIEIFTDHSRSSNQVKLFQITLGIDLNGVPKKFFDQLLRNDREFNAHIRYSYAKFI